MAERRPRLFLIAPRHGGVGHVADEVASAAERRGWAVDALRLDAHDAPARTAVRAVRVARRQLRAADAVHVELGSNDRGVFWAALLAAGERRDVVVVAHDAPRLANAPGSGLLGASGRIRSPVSHRVVAPLLDPRLTGRLSASAGGWLVLGEAAADAWRHEVSAPVDIVAHGGSPPTPGALPPSVGDAVLFAGFVAPHKGVDTLIDAWGRIERPGLPLVIAGGHEATHRSHVDAIRAAGERLADPPVWTGPLSDTEFAARIARAAIVVMPYRHSSPASGVLVRAMTEGRPVLGTPVPAMTEAIRPGIDGLIVPAGDPQALAQTLGELLRSPATRDRLGAAAAASAAARHSWDAYIATCERAWARAAGRAGADRKAMTFSSSHGASTPSSANADAIALESSRS